MDRTNVFTSMFKEMNKGERFENNLTFKKFRKIIFQKLMFSSFYPFKIDQSIYSYEGFSVQNLSNQ